MIHEFALEPDVLASWDGFRYFSEKFGVENGRLISLYPKRWKRLVIDSCANCQDIEKLRIVEKLTDESFDRKLVRSRREYDGEQDWLRNAEAQQATTNPFRAIVARQDPREHDDVCIASEVDESDERWSVPRALILERTPDAFGDSTAMLLRCSREILFVDPYFDPQERRFLTVLEAFLANISVEQKVRRLELHVSRHRKSATTKEWLRQCHMRLPKLIPAGLDLRVVRWAKRENGERLHARYVLTERGGIHFDVGLDEGHEGETSDVSLLERKLYELRWQEFGNASPAFDQVDQAIIEGVRR